MSKWDKLDRLCMVVSVVALSYALWLIMLDDDWDYHMLVQATKVCRKLAYAFGQAGIKCEVACAELIESRKL